MTKFQSLVTQGLVRDCDYNRVLYEQEALFEEWSREQYPHSSLSQDSEGDYVANDSAFRWQGWWACHGCAELAQGHQSALAALAELVACKDLKDAEKAAREKHYGSGITDDYREAKRLREEYERRQPLAWEAARRVLAEGHQSERSETAVQRPAVARPRFITFTGADEHTSIEEMQALSRQYPIEWGILLSPKRQGQGRYPPLSFVRRLVAMEGLHLSAHLCGAHSRDVIEKGDEGLGLAGFERAQINSAATNINLDVIAGWAEWRGVRAILQCRGSFPASTDVAWLYDKSGGKGIVPMSWPAPHPTQISGYAGGIGPDNVLDVLSKIEATDFWIDMESGVRDEDDRFSLDKCRAVCEAVYGALASTEQASAVPAFTVPIEPSREWHWQVAERMKENTGPNSQPSGWFIGDVARYHRAMREVAAEQASAVSPPALAKLRAEVEALAKPKPYRHAGHAETIEAVLALIDKHGGALEQQQGHQSALAALAELVACKDLKDRSHSEEGIVHTAGLFAEYKRRQPLAWETARRVLAEGHQSERSETAKESGNG